jgi:hypothetical protein
MSMANVKWPELQVGDFFTASIDNGEHNLLYQKIRVTDGGYNAVLLNTGELCQLYVPVNSNKTFEKVEVTFDFKPTE